MEKSNEKTALLPLLWVTTLGLAEPGAIEPQEISAERLCAHVKILAAEPRATPSFQNVKAARFIEEQFRAAGLEPAATTGYFQTASFVLHTPSQVQAEVIAEGTGGRVRVVGSDLGVGLRCEGSPSGSGPPIITTVAGLAQLDPARTRGRLLLVSGSDYRPASRNSA